MNSVTSTRDAVRMNKEIDTLNQISELEAGLKSEGWELVYGTIGKRTTYLLISKEDEEVVGYTFIKNLQYNNPNVGKLKAIQQVIARRDLSELKDLCG